MVTYDLKHTLRIFELDSVNDKLVKVFDAKHCAQQLPILANSDFNNYRDLMHRSVTDLSMNLMISDDPMLTHHLAMELHKEQVQV